MKVIVFGATGGTGSQVVEQALDAGHEVTAIARRPAAITLQHQRLQVVQADVFDPASFAGVMAGQEVVVSALGVTTNAPTTLYSEGVGNIMAAMRDTGVRRIICVSASGLDPGPLWQRWFAKPLLHMAFKNGYADMARMEEAVRESGLDWTIVRPPKLNDDARTGRYQIVVNKHLSRGWKISRADLADYIVNHLNDVSSYCGMVEVAY